MTGGGFGGCVIALIEATAAHAVAGAIEREFARRGFAKPRSFVATPAAGVSRLPLP
jgi:galactokinase